MQKQQEAQRASEQLTTGMLSQALFHMMLPNVSTCPADYIALVSIHACRLHDRLLCMLLQSPCMQTSTHEFCIVVSSRVLRLP